MEKTNLMTANRQWASRPADERFWNLDDLRAALWTLKNGSKETSKRIGDLTPVVIDEDVGVATNVGQARLTHWSFQQYATALKAPAGFLRELSPKLAVDILAEQREKIADNAQIKLLLNKNTDGLVQARGITGPDYGRIWNHDVALQLNRAVDLGWRVPPARPHGSDPRSRPATEADILPNQGDFALSVKVGDMIAPAGCYAGDRDMFVFMVHPERSVGDGFMRGVFVYNSEVGGHAFYVRTFLLEHVCGNHICWGASGVREIKIVHRKNAPFAFEGKTIRQLREYAALPSGQEEAAIRQAKMKTLGTNKVEVVAEVFGNKTLLISKGEAEEAWGWAERWQHTAKADPTTVWGFAHGLTRYSQTQGNADERNRLDRAAGRLLDSAAAGALAPVAMG